MSVVSVVLSLTVVVCGDSAADDAVCAADLTSVDMIVDDALRVEVCSVDTGAAGATDDGTPNDASLALDTGTGAGATDAAVSGGSGDNHRDEGCSTDGQGQWMSIGAESSADATTTSAEMDDLGLLLNLTIGWSF